MRDGPNGKLTSAALAPTDLFTMSIVLDAVAYLRRNAVPGELLVHVSPNRVVGEWNVSE